MKIPIKYLVVTAHAYCTVILHTSLNGILWFNLQMKMQEAKIKEEYLFQSLSIFLA